MSEARAPLLENQDGDEPAAASTAKHPKTTGYTEENHVIKQRVDVVEGYQRARSGSTTSISSLKNVHSYNVWG